MGGWWSDKNKLMLISTHVKVVVVVWLEKVLKKTFTSVCVGGGVDQVGIRLSTKLKLNLSLATI